MRLDRFVGQAKKLGRRDVRAVLAAGRVMVAGTVVTDGHYPVDDFSAVVLDGESLRKRQGRYLMLHKPKGCVSATRDPIHPTVLDLIENAGGLHLAGRLDFNTTGLILLTNDGGWSRRLTSPARKWPKVYRVRTEDPIREEYAEVFARGLHFRYENLITRPAELSILGEREARLTLVEGRYHHVKRLFGHFDNKVVALHRECIGPIGLDPALAAGQYRPLTGAEIRLRGHPVSAHGEAGDERGQL